MKYRTWYHGYLLYEEDGRVLLFDRMGRHVCDEPNMATAKRTIDGWNDAR